MSGGQSPSPAGHDGAGGHAAPWPLWATDSVQVDSTHSALQGPDQVPAQSMFGAVAHPPVASSHAWMLGAAQQAHSSMPAADAAPCIHALSAQSFQKATSVGWLTITGASPAAPQPGEPVPQV